MGKQKIGRPRLVPKELLKPGSAMILAHKYLSIVVAYAKATDPTDKKNTVEMKLIESVSSLIEKYIRTRRENEFRGTFVKSLQDVHSQLSKRKVTPVEAEKKLIDIIDPPNNFGGLGARYFLKISKDKVQQAAAKLLVTKDDLDRLRGPKATAGEKAASFDGFVSKNPEVQKRWNDGKPHTAFGITVGNFECLRELLVREFGLLPDDAKLVSDEVVRRSTWTESKEVDERTLNELSI